MTDEMNAPKRLLEGADDAYLRDLLGAGAAELPGDEAMQRLATKLEPVLAGGAGGAGGAGAAGAGSSGAGSGLATGGGAVVAGAATGTAGKVLLGAFVVALAMGVAGVAMKGSTSSSTLTTTSSASTPTATPTATETPTSTSTPTPTPTSTSTPTPTSTETRPSTSTQTSPSTRTSASPSSSPAEPEIVMLQRAQDALRGRPADALEQANDHRKRYPDGMLAQEREVIAVEALEKLGRGAEADQRAAAFVRRYPGSSHISRLSTLVGHAL